MPRKILGPPSNNVLGTEEYAGSPGRTLCLAEECQPWTKKEDLPGRSYKTSYRLGHPVVHPFFTSLEAMKLDYPEDTTSKDYLVKNKKMESSYKSAYVKKCDCYGGHEKLNAPHSLKFSMLFNWAERLRSAPVRKTHETLSEMKDRYKLHLSDVTNETSGVLNDVKPYTLCNIRAVAKDAQTKTNVDEQCVQKVLDPYISTQQYDYIYHSPNTIAKYRHKKLKPAELITRRKFPIYDESVLRLKFMDRLFREKTSLVPHSGMSTEVRDNYRLPLNELAHKKNLFCSSIVRTGLTKGEVMAIPAMYHTDYSHVGRHWPVSSIL